jgi:hypothetical protein
MILNFIIGLVIILVIFYLINIYLGNNEYFCYSNSYCNGNKDSALCINQECLDCGLQSTCETDDQCSPSLCNDGCCDSQ